MGNKLHSEVQINSTKNNNRSDFYNLYLARGNNKILTMLNNNGMLENFHFNIKLQNLLLTTEILITQILCKLLNNLEI